jgi:hypothetical protein
MVDKQIKELNNNIKAFEYSFQNENEIKNEIFIAVIDENNKLIDMRVSKEKEDDIFLPLVLEDLENTGIKYDKSLNFEYLIENERHFDKCFEYALTIDVFLEEHFKGKNEFLLYSKAQDILTETFKNSDTNEISEIDKKTIEIAFLKEYENSKEYDLEGNSVLNLSKIEFRKISSNLEELGFESAKSIIEKNEKEKGENMEKDNFGLAMEKAHNFSSEFKNIENVSLTKLGEFEKNSGDYGGEDIDETTKVYGLKRNNESFLIEKTKTSYSGGEYSESFEMDELKIFKDDIKKDNIVFYTDIKTSDENITEATIRIYDKEKIDLDENFKKTLSLLNFEVSDKALKEFEKKENETIKEKYFNDLVDKLENKIERIDSREDNVSMLKMNEILFDSEYELKEKMPKHFDRDKVAVIDMAVENSIYNLKTYDENGYSIIDTGEFLKKFRFEAENQYNDFKKTLTKKEEYIKEKEKNDELEI